MAPIDTTRIGADIERYVNAGVKHAGGPADAAVGAWVESALRHEGFEVARQDFETPYHISRDAFLSVNEQKITVLPQALVVATDQGGLRGRIVRADKGGPLTDSIALVILPHARWSTLTARTVAGPVEDAVSRGAKAVLIVTNGPTGEAIFLNAAAAPSPREPLAIVAPRHAGPVLEAAARGDIATLTLTGATGRRTAFNVHGRLQRSAEAPWLVMSTPRSGWTLCAGERGPGIAVWLALARWAPSALTRYNLAVVCNSGHEYENLGAGHLLDSIAPPPSRTALWLHLGANVATRDWHEAQGRLLPLPSADAQRYLVTSDDLLPAARTAFAGQAGLEHPYPVSAGAAGELANVIGAGYRRVAGVFGAHRFHHVAGDDMSVIEPALIARAAESFRALLIAALA
ncbi:MAG: hypothetical protein IV086_02895 [Hyphomonadaceae bacterium]|nr:hypothetical protein [Hyphomonadaceae bacterium]